MADPDTTQPALPFGEEVQQLLALHGIQDSFINYAGEHQQITYSNRLAVLGLMGLPLTASSDVGALLDDYRERARGHWLPAATAVACEHTAGLPLEVAHGELDTGFEWRLVTEAGDSLSGSFLPRDLPEAGTSDAVELAGIRRLEIPPLPAGYHQLTLKTAQSERQVTIIATPERCHQPDWNAAGRRLAGMSVHLYELRSARNWGMGDFTDLAALVRHAAGTGLDFVVLNPLHILDSLAPENCSPYSPLDRRFLNPLYIDVECEPDYLDHPSVRDYVARPAFQSRLAELRATELVDYDSISHIKHTVLSKMFKRFREQHLEQPSPRGDAFRSWLQNKGEVLRKFGEFQAHRHRLSVHMARHAEFHYYLQWLAEAQLKACQDQAREAGMAIGLVRDLAVGSDRNGAEVHLNPQLFCPDASVGAPPDPLAPQGQNWGLPPMNPLVLKQTGYAHFIELLKDNMAHCGALRIDHIMSLMRLWWCPGQDHTGKGAYVSYPAADLFAILKLESHRQQCVIIGEDLGIVPPEIRHLMGESAVFSNLLFYFEKYDPIHFRHPHDWNPNALAMVANHDVPTLAAWWSKRDLALREEIGLFANPQEMADAIRARESDLIQILHWLNGLHLLPENWRDFNIHRIFDNNLCQAILQACAGSAARLVSIQPEDLCLVEAPINIPGTSREYPNWQRKLPTALEDLFSGPDSRQLLDAFVAARRNA
ncbi:MAG: 4-alpha-glucanotransferase [Gammaproteobacteria bacterium]|nr:4-alpha-glucanotransferase [Pseudomonadales bacterium]MCP5348633.1 4-alpha-glucanotransferase [Pseudomonadales bacterium]